MNDKELATLLRANGRLTSENLAAGLMQSVPSPTEISSLVQADQSMIDGVAPLPSKSVEALRHIHLLCKAHHPVVVPDVEPALPSLTFHDLLDQMRWIAVLGWVAHLDDETRERPEVRAASGRDWGDPPASIEPRWGIALADLTAIDWCPHTDWLLEEARRIEARDVDRFTRIGKVRYAPRTLAGAGKVTGYRPGITSKRADVVFQRGFYALDTSTGKVVYDGLDPKGWVPLDADEGYTLENAERAVRKEVTKSQVVVLIVSLALGLSFGGQTFELVRNWFVAVPAGLLVAAFSTYVLSAIRRLSSDPR